MATLAPTITYIGNHTVKFVWGPITQTNDNGAPIAERFADYTDRSVQMTGAFGAGTVHLEGSNDDGANYAPVTDPQGNAISKTGAAVEQVTEITQKMRPRASAADGTTSVTVTVIAKRQRGGKEI